MLYFNLIDSFKITKTYGDFMEHIHTYIKFTQL